MSIILRVVRSGKNLKKSLNSLLDQTIKKEVYEIIAVDDASKDNSADILRSYGDKLIVIKNDRPLGGPKCRNIAAKKAKGKIILFTDVDCIADENLLKNHMMSHSIHESSAVIGNINWEKDGSKSLFLEFIEQSEFWVRQTAHDISDPENVSYLYTYGANMSLPKKVFFSIGMADERIFPGYYSDTELGYRLNKNGIKIVYNKDAKVFHSSDLNISDFSKRMIAVGKASVKLDSINPKVFDFSNWKKEKSSIFKLMFQTKKYLFIAFFLQFFEGLYHNENLRKCLFEVYKKQLDYSFRLGFQRALQAK